MPLSTGTVGANRKSSSNCKSGPGIDPSTLTEEQLEHLLARKRCQQEEEQLESSIGNVVAMLEETAKVVGPILTMDIDIDGVILSAMVDTGAQSTIISCNTLHTIVRHMKENG